MAEVYITNKAASLSEQQGLNPVTCMGWESLCDTRAEHLQPGTGLCQEQAQHLECDLAVDNAGHTIRTEYTGQPSNDPLPSWQCLQVPHVCTAPRIYYALFARTACCVLEVSDLVLPDGSAASAGSGWVLGPHPRPQRRPERARRTEMRGRSGAVSYAKPCRLYPDSKPGLEAKKINNWCKLESCQPAFDLAAGTIQLACT